MSCTLGPDYNKIEVKTPEKFQEASGIEWQVIKPHDGQYDNEWWKIFKDPFLDQLEEKLTKDNYNIKAAESSYNEALALIDKVRTTYLPTVTSGFDITRQTTSTTSNKTVSKPVSNHSLLFTTSWETDLWGNISREVESYRASSGSAKALLAAARLSSQSSLAQYYFELRMLDKNQELLNKIVAVNEDLLKYTKNRYLSGVDDDQDIVQIEQQLENAKVQAINNGINRAQYQHAIAVLIGEMPSNFSIVATPAITYKNVTIPITVPSEILERRPDIANAEREVAVASAGIGIAKSAFFPTLTISGSTTSQGSGIGNLLSLPTLIWSLGPQLALNITNLAAYKSTTTAAQENYNASVASYRQTVLAAFQNVEDNLVAVRILQEQSKLQKIITDKAKRNLDIVTNQYNVGTVDQSGLLSAKILFYNAELALNNLNGLRTTTSVTLMTSLGGGWE